MKHALLLLLSLLLFSCDSNNEDSDNTPILPKNIAIVTNQGSGFLTVVDLNTNTIREEINLGDKLKSFADGGGSIPDPLYIEQPRPHYVQTSYDGKFIYVVHTNRQGAIIKLNASFDVVAFKAISGTAYTAHLQLSKDNKNIYLSTWTTNMGQILEDNSFMIHLSADDLSEIRRVPTPADSHGIKLTPDESKVIIGHDLIDYISIIKGSTNQQISIRSGAKTNLTQEDKESGKILSPTQLGISPDGELAFFSCKEASKLLVFDVVNEDTVGFLDLKEYFNTTDKLGPYSVEVGPKENYTSAAKKYVYVNLKVGGSIARFELNPTATSVNTILTNGERMELSSKDSRPHGLDITDDGKIAVVSSEFFNSDASNSKQGQTYIIDLENWSVLKSLNTKFHSRGLCIYPSIGN